MQLTVWPHSSKDNNNHNVYTELAVVVPGPALSALHACEFT